ncbi:cysteine--tRNA ligase [Stappia taiwanensis]|uniref:Cysteine--tRNA ligase n=1 Tax=Stappia taiwanensis TaxID=992267 RepID=A0A838XNB9_9HYPH|nr:cysteine--tRNA ligase [Stappia taiwanensis]MBA4611682.1 cysteine--tRNA ligase [Stappia taiwanensis]GGE97609.1 cysteine--tRNA ligase [Stappia taiwanensis]
MSFDHAFKLTNTLTRTKDVFVPEDRNNVRMYVCGPTVYDYAHIGNARPVVVFDMLFRLLRHLYGAEHVTYVRNITDVDDKINARAAAEGVSIGELTERTAAQYHADMRALGALDPTIEPRATEHIAEMKAMIEQLVAKGHAYVAEGHVLFDVGSMADYGKLSGRSLEDMQAGARVEVAPYKKDPMDFVLWKPSKEGEPGWPGPCGIEEPGRPGWHIECSAMARRHLGETFDIHGGGADLVFPHHENEVAQSRCSHDTEVMARYWLHNGFLQVEGEKMSKSLGNFITVHDLLDTDKLGGRVWPGAAIRLALLMTHYRQPLDFTEKSLSEAEGLLQKWDGLLSSLPADQADTKVPDALVEALCDDLNTPRAIAVLHGLAREARGGEVQAKAALAASLNFLGIDLAGIRAAAEEATARAADPELAARVDGLIAERNAARAAKNWGEADRIRDLLAAEGVVLKDTRNADTGTVETTWELAR